MPLFLGASVTLCMCEQSPRPQKVGAVAAAPPLVVSSGDTKKRNSKDGAVGIYDDTILLSSTDYLVGTFSSQVSRLAYEVSLVNGSSTHPVADPSLHYHSVDSMW